MFCDGFRVKRECLAEIELRDILARCFAGCAAETRRGGTGLPLLARSEAHTEIILQKVHYCGP